MVKTDKKVIRKPAVKKTAKKTTKKAVAKKVTKKSTKKKVTKQQPIDFSNECMMAFFKDVMPQMIVQLKAGVSRERIMEMVYVNKGQIDIVEGIANFKFDNKSYSIKKDKDNYWKMV